MRWSSRSVGPWCAGAVAAARPRRPPRRGSRGRPRGLCGAGPLLLDLVLAVEAWWRARRREVVVEVVRSGRRAGKGGVRGPSRPPGPGPSAGRASRARLRAPAPWPRRSPPIGFPPPRDRRGACPQIARAPVGCRPGDAPRSCAMSAIIALLSAPAFPPRPRLHARVHPEQVIVEQLREIVRGVLSRRRAVARPPPRGSRPPITPARCLLPRAYLPCGKTLWVVTVPQFFSRRKKRARRPRKIVHGNSHEETIALGRRSDNNIGDLKGRITEIGALDLVQSPRESATSPMRSPKPERASSDWTSYVISDPSCVNEASFTAECHATSLFAAASSSEAARPLPRLASHPDGH